MLIDMGTSWYDTEAKFVPHFDKDGKYTGGHYCPYIPKCFIKEKEMNERDCSITLHFKAPVELVPGFSDAIKLAAIKYLKNGGLGSNAVLEGMNFIVIDPDLPAGFERHEDKNGV